MPSASRFEDADVSIIRTGRLMSNFRTANLGARFGFYSVKFVGLSNVSNLFSPTEKVHVRVL